MRIVFMGSPEFAVDSLKELAENSHHEVVAVITQPDRPKGRGQKVLMTAVKEYAMTKCLPVLQPAKIRNKEFIEELRALKPELIVVVAFGQFLPKDILQMPKYGCINVHASLLPKYRGAAPIHYAIMNGEKETGVTIMMMDEGMDTGAMLSKSVIEISDDMTMGCLHDQLKIAGAKLLIDVVEGLERGTIKPIPQNNDEATYASLLDKKIEKIVWSSTAKEIHNKVRGLNPWPGAHSFLPDGRNLKIWQTRVAEKEYFGVLPGTIIEFTKGGFLVACGKGCLEVLEVQPESKKKMSADVFCNGYKIKLGEILPIEV
ncbi:MAG: methionyl-tRNA formyltransferase [Acholeplasmataceae bacterium]|nr:methionyl-tRNA formyltransferase [Acholeplasmataceae bacterium]